MVMPISTFMTQMVINFKYTGKMIINKLPDFINVCFNEREHTVQTFPYFFVLPLPIKWITRSNPAIRMNIGANFKNFTSLGYHREGVIFYPNSLPFLATPLKKKDAFLIKETRPILE